MNLASSARLMLFPFVIAFLAFYARRFYQNTDRVGRSTLIRFIISTSLIPIHPIVRSIDPTPLFIHLISIPTQYYALYFAYLAFYQMKYDKLYLPIKKDPIFYITTTGSLLSIFFAWLLGSNLGSFSDNTPFIRENPYFLHYFLNYSLMFFLCSRLIYTHITKSTKYKDIADKIRINFGIFSAIPMVIGSFSMVMNVTLLFFNANYDRVPLNNIYHINKGLFGLLSLVTCVLICLPRAIIMTIFSPILNYTHKNRQKDIEMIHYLYDIMRKIIPAIELNGSFTTFDDKLVEIADGWLLIWSTEKRHAFMTAKDDAKVLYRLLCHNTRIHEPGDLEPPRYAKDEIRYNAKIARFLKNMEGINV